MPWLVDTNILSDARKPRPDYRIANFFQNHRASELYVSAVTFAEIRFGIELLDDLARRAALTDWLALELRPMFDGRVLPVTEDVLLKWRLLMQQRRKAVIPTPPLTSSSRLPRFTTTSRSSQGIEVITTGQASPFSIHGRIPKLALRQSGFASRNDQCASNLHRCRAILRIPGEADQRSGLAPGWLRPLKCRG